MAAFLPRDELVDYFEKIVFTNKSFIPNFVFREQAYPSKQLSFCGFEKL